MNFLTRLNKFARRILRAGLNSVFMVDYSAEAEKRERIEQRLDHMDAHLQARSQARLRLLEAEAKTMGRQK